MKRNRHGSGNESLLFSMFLRWNIHIIVSGIIPDATVRWQCCHVEERQHGCLSNTGPAEAGERHPGVPALAGRALRDDCPIHIECLPGCLVPGEALRLAQSLFAQIGPQGRVV